MGCNSSSVVPLGETDIIDGAGIKVRVNPSTPETIKLQSPNTEGKSSLPKKFTSPPLESSEPPVETLTNFNTTENQRGESGQIPVEFEFLTWPTCTKIALVLTQKRVLGFLFPDQSTHVTVPPPPPMAFEVPVNEESLIKKHPPKRFRRLEEQLKENSKTLTHEWIDIKQQEAEMRRKEILSQRVLSAQQKNSHNRKLIHSDAFSQKSEDLVEWDEN